MSIFKNKIKKKAYLYKADLKKKLTNSYLHQTLEIAYYLFNTMILKFLIDLTQQLLHGSRNAS